MPFERTEIGLYVPVKPPEPKKRRRGEPICIQDCARCGKAYAEIKEFYRPSLYFPGVVCEVCAGALRREHGGFEELC